MLIHAMFIWNIMFLSVSVASVSQADSVKGSSLLWACEYETIKNNVLQHICSVLCFCIVYCIKAVNNLVWGCFFQHMKNPQCCTQNGCWFYTAFMSSTSYNPHSEKIPKAAIIRWKRAGGSYSSWDQLRRGFSAFQAWLCPPPLASLEICLAANMLWKALISYLGRSSMHQDNKPHLISLCSLMSQLKGLVLPLAMGLAERIVCRLVNTGLWRSWSVFKMLVLSHRRSCMRTLARWLPPAFPCQMAWVPHNGL